MHPSSVPVATGTRVLVLQHMTLDGPGYLATWLQSKRIAFDIFNTEAGERFPPTMDDYAALAVLGGEMGANDDLPSLRQAEMLIRHAIATGRPVIGHCLGGQLMARALGARVAPSPEPEVGWHAVPATDCAPAREWFGRGPLPEVFQWHFDAFDLPAGAVSLAGSPGCPCQAFALGPHLGLQFHVEVDAFKLAQWAPARDPFIERARARWAGVQTPDQMLERAEGRLAAQQVLAARLYTHWLSGAGSISHQANDIS